MLSRKSYLARAIHEWILDSGCTPHIIVNALMPDVCVPQQHVKNGQIVLNIAHSAVVGLVIDRNAICFSARFGGVPMDIYIPMYALMGIYARESGDGIMFEHEDSPEPEKTPPTPSGGSKVAVTGRPSLRVVK
ncbi:MAG TPA: ClpXP protease specificity-enhancing factor [Pseudomonadales bacterium]|nr:ClpXP protease specificity-enhancing factor [Pseudomonadales bacterium]